MTTIMIKEDIKELSRTEFENEFELLKYLASLSDDYNEPGFKDTVVTKELEQKAEETKEKLKSNPSLLFRICNPKT